MDPGWYKEKYADRFVLMGGLDVQTTIGFGKFDFLRSEIQRVMTMFAQGGLLFCTSHFVQDHCSMEELTLAFDTAYRLTRRLGAEQARPVRSVPRGPVRSAPGSALETRPGARAEE